MKARMRRRMAGARDAAPRKISVTRSPHGATLVLMDRQVISKQRVADHGEVLTGKREVNAMLDLATRPQCVVIAPDRREEGTNALLVRPPNAIAFAYGASSFDAHRRQAQERSIPIAVYRSPTLALDLDVPDDLAFYQEGAPLFDWQHRSE